MSDSAELRSKIQQELIQSGEYDKISLHLKQQLLSNGWVDQIRSLTHEELSKNPNINFEELNQSIQNRSMKLIPSDVRENSLIEIKTFLEGVLEKEL
ncbi:hypothetical protein WICPIJ_000798 [Wickerhamomyces pijperi]|uniref:Transcription and mRNA export factor SUS1 n=1 Tax=Wickerhamomyces pijperi TaxID=599730 RepID=A0A9P8QF89_WICPI|nr:hypothetical protein WICPIJ_000798 [Wickerhamomyces pijperi]